MKRSRVNWPSLRVDKQALMKLKIISSGLHLAKCRRQFHDKVVSITPAQIALPAGASSTLTMLAGGNNPVSAHLVIMQVA